MSIFNLIVGVVVTLYGFTKVAAEPTGPLGWLTMGLGIFIFLKSFWPDRNPDKGPIVDGSDWGGGNDCGSGDSGGDGCD